MEQPIFSQAERHKNLRDAQAKAETLFNIVEQRGLIKSGVSEREINQSIYELAFEIFGIRKYWHKRIVRAGENTLFPYKENPPDLEIRADDILFLDFGPIFEDWEADFGRTYVIGNDPAKLRLAQAIEECWQIGKEHYHSSPEITGAQLFSFMSNLAKQRDYAFGAEHCGHLIGHFPHEKIQGDEVSNYIHPQNPENMRTPSKSGHPREWILEVHFVDRQRKIGAFYEQLLTVEYP